jgi:tetratricopeptide (TPR) repeat protein
LLLHQYDQALLDFTTAKELDETNNWCYYGKALSNLALGQKANAKADLLQAIRLAQQDCDKDINDHGNAFNLALYYLVLRNPEKSKQLYQAVLSREMPASFLNGAICDLKELLIIFPNYPQAQVMQDFLQQFSNKAEE